MLKGKIIICYSGTNWELPWGITQRLMERFSRSNRVIYIEYQPSFLHCYLRSLSYIEYKMKDRGSFRKANDNLYLYRPKVGLPFNNYFRTINILNQKSIIRDVKSQMGGHSPADIILWTFVPYAIDFINNLDRFFTVYHCLGNYPIEKANFLRRRTVSGMEEALVDRSDMVVAQTRSLCERFKALNKTVFYLPSAVNLDRFRHGSVNIGATAPVFNGIKHPRIGIVGYFDDNFYDIDLLRYLLDERQDWSFIFIGPVTGKAKRFRLLQKSTNAFFLGYKSPEEIPAYINQIDVGIIPYKVNEYMNEVSPTKFYEYAACGKPVVSTSLPDLSSYSEALRIGKDRFEFLGHIEDILSQGEKEALREKAIQIAEENSFDRYFEELSKMIEHVLNESNY